MPQSPVSAYQKHQHEQRSIETYSHLVKRIAHHLLARLPDNVQLDDLIQAGMVGLIEATSKYDASKGASFETYAGIRIRGAMLDEMRRGDWSPRSVHRKARELSQKIKEVEHNIGRVPSDREVADAMQVSLDDYYNIVQDAANCKLVSYEDVNESDESNLLPAIDSDDHGLEYQQLLGNLTEAMSQLPERDRLVMALYYHEELNLKEIGAVLGVSESRVSQILSAATVKVRGKIAQWETT